MFHMAMDVLESCLQLIMSYQKFSSIFADKLLATAGRIFSIVEFFALMALMKGQKRY